MNPRPLTWPGRNVCLILLLALILIAGQAAASAHSHGDNKPAADCELCLQLTHVLPISHALSQVATSTPCLSLPGAESPILVLRAACARGPPSLLS